MLSGVTVAGQSFSNVSVVTSGSEVRLSVDNVVPRGDTAVFVVGLALDGAGAAAVEHAELVRRAGGPLPTELLVERGGAVEHVLHSRHARHVPVSDRRGECRGVLEHAGHLRHARHVPAADPCSSEGRGAAEHLQHIRHTRDVPPAQVLVEVRPFAIDAAAE